MSRARPAMPRTLAAVMAGCLGLAACASHRAEPPTAVPAALQVPGAAVLAAVLRGSGVQIYQCEAEAGDPRRFFWAFQSPAADLADASGRNVGRHYAGPTWEGYDGSKVVGEVVAKDAGPDPGGSIPWLLVRAKSTVGKGLFAKTAFIQRLHTVGGLAPTEPCDAARASRRVRVPYAADYYVYRR